MVDREIPIEVIGDIQDVAAVSVDIHQLAEQLTRQVNSGRPPVATVPTRSGSRSNRGSWPISGEDSTSSRSNRTSLIITHEDGSVEENTATVTSLGLSSEDIPNRRLMIEEVLSGDDESDEEKGGQREQRVQVQIHRSAPATAPLASESPPPALPPKLNRSSPPTAGNAPAAVHTMDHSPGHASPPLLSSSTETEKCGEEALRAAAERQSSDSGPSIHTSLSTTAEVLVQPVQLAVSSVVQTEGRTSTSSEAGEAVSAEIVLSSAEDVPASAVPARVAIPVRVEKSVTKAMIAAAPVTLAAALPTTAADRVGSEVGLTASEQHQQPVDCQASARPDPRGVEDLVFASEPETSGGEEWAPDGQDCYSLELDSTWEVVENAQELVCDELSSFSDITVQAPEHLNIEKLPEKLVTDSLMTRSSEAGPKVIRIPIHIESAVGSNTSNAAAVDNSSSSCQNLPTDGRLPAGAVSKKGPSSLPAAGQVGGLAGGPPSSPTYPSTTTSRIIPIVLSDGMPSGSLPANTGTARTGGQGAAGLKAMLAGSTVAVEERPTSASVAASTRATGELAKNLVRAASTSGSDIRIETRRHYSGEESQRSHVSNTESRTVGRHASGGEPHNGGRQPLSGEQLAGGRQTSSGAMLSGSGEICRTIPIQLATGQVIQPRFTDLQEPAPPTWSVFHQKGGEVERVVPIRVERTPANTTQAATGCPQPDAVATPQSKEIQGQGVQRTTVATTEAKGAGTSRPPQTPSGPAAEAAYGARAKVPAYAGKSAAGTATPVPTGASHRTPSNERAAKQTTPTTTTSSGSSSKHNDGFTRLRESLPAASEFRSSVEREVRSTASNFQESKSEMSELRSEFSSTRSEMLNTSSASVSHSSTGGGGNKPPSGTRIVPVKRVPSKDETAGTDTLPSTWTPHMRKEEEETRGCAAGTKDGAGGRGGLKEETQQDCLTRVHAELEAARQQLSQQMEQMKGSLPRNTVPYVGRPQGVHEARSRSVEGDRQTPSTLRRDGGEVRNRPSFRRDRSLQDIDKDIETIWKELQELDRLPVDTPHNARHQQNKPSGGERPPSAPPSLSQQALITPSWRTVRTRTQSENQGGPPLVTRARATIRDIPPSTTSQPRTIWDTPTPTSSSSHSHAWDDVNNAERNPPKFPPAPVPPAGAPLSSSWDAKPNYFPTAAGPTHFSFLPKAETKPGAITPNYVGNYSTRASGPIASRTVPIVKEGTTDPYRKLDFPSYSSRDKINIAKPSGDTQKLSDTRRPWTYRPEEWRGVASLSHPNLRDPPPPGERRRDVAITRSESPASGQHTNLKSCLKDSKTKSDSRTRSVSPLGRVSPTKQSVNFRPDPAVKDMCSGPGDSAYDWVDVGGESKPNKSEKSKVREVPITTLPIKSTLRELSHVGNGGKSPDSHVTNGGNPFGPEGVDSLLDKKEKTLIATEEACFACDACTQTEAKEKKNGCHMM